MRLHNLVTKLEAVGHFQMLDVYRVSISTEIRPFENVQIILNHKTAALYDVVVLEEDSMRVCPSKQAVKKSPAEIKCDSGSSSSSGKVLKSLYILAALFQWVVLWSSDSESFYHRARLPSAFVFHRKAQLAAPDSVTTFPSNQPGEAALEKLHRCTAQPSASHKGSSSRVLTDTMAGLRSQASVRPYRKCSRYKASALSSQLQLPCLPAATLPCCDSDGLLSPWNYLNIVKYICTSLWLVLLMVRTFPTSASGYCRLQRTEECKVPDGESALLCLVDRHVDYLRNRGLWN
nr:uncharacterized protein LOC120102517 [Rattus norvegicus]